MKVALDWLSDHIDLSGYSQPELDDLLTFSGIEVEGIGILTTPIEAYPGGET